jgi:hypothetical protein
LSWIAGHKGLKGKEFATIRRVDAGHVLEKARLGNVALAWRWNLGRRFNLVATTAGLARHPESQQTRSPRGPFGRRQTDVGRIGCQRLDVPEELLGSVGGVETQAGDLAVVGRRPHRVERRSGRLVVAQIVDRVRPQSESGSAFGQNQLDPSLAARFRPAQVQQHHRNAGEFQLPVRQPVRLPLQSADANVRLAGAAIQTHKTLGLSQIPEIIPQ